LSVFRRALVSGLAAVALLTACGDDPAEPKVLPSQSTSGSASASPSVSPTPATPAAAAEAAARRYYAELTKAYATGDVSVLRSLHAVSCPCKKLTDGIEAAWKEGSLEGGVYRVTGVRVAEANEKAAIVEVDMSVSEIVEKDRAGKVKQRFPGDPEDRTLLDVVLVGNRWLVARITLLGG
jgi:predicted lipid-binding transport protein (Tim44 family)